MKPKLNVNLAGYLNRNVLTTVMALAALVVASYSLYLSYLPVSSSRILARNFGADPKAVVVKNLEINTRLDGTLKYFIDNRRELIANVEVTNFLENNGVGIAFVRTSVGNKRYQYCLWMRKYPTGWESIGWISPNPSSDPFRRAWIKENENWIRDMDNKKADWEMGSDCVWELKSKTPSAGSR